MIGIDVSAAHVLMSRDETEKQEIKRQKANFIEGAKVEFLFEYT